MEEWRDVNGYIGKYRVSSMGRVFSVRRGIILKQTNDNGYRTVGLCCNYNQKKMRVHRLVAKAFIENPNHKPIVHHRNRDRADNNLSNLEWVTQRENTNYANGVTNNATPKQRKKRLWINQLSCDGRRIINTFEYATDAHKYTLISISGIRRCCNNKQNYAGGYKWEYVQLVDSDLFKYGMIDWLEKFFEF